MHYRTGAALLLLLVIGCAGEPATEPTSKPFTLAVIPDTQNYIDYRHQTAEGFALDGTELFLAQMRDIARRDEVVFVAAVGDVWQHSSIDVDPEHAARGKGAIDNPLLDAALAPTPKTHSMEIPMAVEGYRILNGSGKPFGVAPGNHDYDAFWSITGFPPNLRKTAAERRSAELDLGVVHVGGLDNFRSVFGAEGEFFKDRPWYVDSFRGGANSAQVFSAGGYRFLHITLEMAADDNALRWASAVVERHPGYPTIVTTHEFLDTRGERRANPIVDLAMADPEHHNGPQAVWQKFISVYDQVFMVLCGHHHGQGRRVDDNLYGNPVYQVLADYQGRGQAGIDAGQARSSKGSVVGLGDGWYRLMHFELGAEIPRVRVETWSSHYREQASTLPDYASWYRDYEQPDLSDSAFVAEDEFILELPGFQERFGPPRLQ